MKRLSPLRPFVIVGLLAVAGCSTNSGLYCDQSTPCTAGHPICDLQGVCPMSEGITNTCIAEACWDASPAGVDATTSDGDSAVDSSVGFDGSTDAAGGPPTWSSLPPVANINSDKFDGHVSASPDGLEIYFSSRRDGAVGSADVYVAKRPTTLMPFGTPANVSIVNTAGSEDYPFVSHDGLELYFNREGSLYVSRRGSIAGIWGQPTSLGIASTRSVSLTADGLTMYYLLDDGLEAPRYRLRRRATVASSWGGAESTMIPGEFGYWSIHISGDELSVLLAAPFGPTLGEFAVELRRPSTMTQFEIHEPLAVLQGASHAAWSKDETVIFATHSADIFTSVLE